MNSDSVPACAHETKALYAWSKGEDETDLIVKPSLTRYAVVKHGSWNATKDWEETSIRVAHGLFWVRLLWVNDLMLNRMGFSWPKLTVIGCVFMPTN